MQGSLTLYQPPNLLPPFLEAAGAKSGHPEDASAGMPKWKDASSQWWAFNQGMGEWQIPHTIKSGDTLFNLSGLYYGKKTLAGVHAIHNVPQNLKIQGPSADSGLIPGDVILIPALPQPTQAPAAADATPIGMPSAPVLSPPVPTPAGSPMPFPIPSTIPASWPTDLGYPPVTGSPSGSDVVLTSYNPGGSVTPTVLPTVEIQGNGQKSPEFWTTGRIAVAAGVGVLGLGTVAYLATRKKSRRRR